MQQKNRDILYLYIYLYLCINIYIDIKYLVYIHVYGMKLCNQTSDPNERQGWKTYVYAPVAKSKSFS